MQRVRAYIDGFNLYKGLRTAFDRRYLWLDLEALCELHLTDEQSLVAVKYFTARVPSPSSSQKRQNTYLDALATKTVVEQIFGRIQPNEEECTACGALVPKPQEKKTDTAIATHMVADALTDQFDTAFLISGDSDMVPPVRYVKEEIGKRVVILFPPRRKSDELRKAAHRCRNLSEQDLRLAQLPDAIRSGHGILLRRPARWA